MYRIRDRDKGNPCNRSPSRGRCKNRESKTAPGDRRPNPHWRPAFRERRRIQDLENGTQRARFVRPPAFERSHRIPVIESNSGRRDYSRSSCDGGRRSSGLVPGFRRGCLRWQELPRCSADAEMIRRRPIQQYHCSLCAGLFPQSERLWWSRTASLAGLLLSPASADAWTGFLGLIRLVRRPSPPRPIGLVEPTLLLDREGFDVLRCRRTGLDARSHGPRPHGRSRVTLLVLAVFGARCDRCRCRASDKHRTENKSGT
jgi:hypothetical protein